MKQNQLKFYVIIILFFSFEIITAQQKINEKGQYENVLHIKFKPDRTKKLDKEFERKALKAAKKEEGYVRLNLKDMDVRNKTFKVSSLKRIFRPAGKYEEKHRKNGLHLWYELVFEANQEVDKVVDAYKEAQSIEIAEPVYQIQLIDGNNTVQKTIATVTDYKNKQVNSVVNDPMYKDQWHYNNTGQKNGTVGRDIHLEEAWEIEKGDARVIVAIQDSGIDVNHPDLIGNLWINSGEIQGNGIDDDNNGYIDDIHGYNFINNTSTIPAGDHGTHVAGTVAAETNNGIGVSGVAGGTGNNDGVRLMACPVIGSGVPNGGAESFVYAADNGAVISQNSYSFRGFTGDVIQLHKEAVDYFIANAGGSNEAMNGGIVFFSAANDNTNLSTYPNTHESIVMVSALNNKDQKASYSNYGNWVDIAAPGGQGQGGVLSTVPDQSYGYKQGTSMACPHMSGVAALVISKNYGDITATQLRRILEGTTDPIDYLNPGFENQLGVGRVNAYKALQVGNGEGIPLGLRVQNITQTSADINWSQISSAQQYNIRYKKSTENNWTLVSAASTTISLNNLEEGQLYEVQVNASGASGVSPYSYIFEFTTKVSSLNPPLGISFTDITETSASIHWNAVSGASGYILEYQEQGNSEWKIVQVDQETEASLFDFTQKTTYNVRVKATNDTVQSAYSAIAFFTTKTSKCGDIAPWKPQQYRIKGTKVAYQDVIYENQWWAESNHIPGVHEVWLKIEECTGTGDNQPPIVNITTPEDNTTIVQQTLTEITLSANAIDSDGTINTLQFEVNATLLQEGNNVSWLPTAFGTYTIKVTVTDNDGAIATDQITITISESANNQPPTVSITQPSDGQVFHQEVLTAITLSAEATDVDGTVISVQFKANDVLLPIGNNINWLPSVFGLHTISVTVTDDKGATATDQVTITIEEVIAGNCNGITPWDPTRIYPSEGGVEVSHKEFIYQNKWWTQNNEPGTGGPWGPWELIGPCNAASSMSITSNTTNNENIRIGINQVTKKMQILLYQESLGNIKMSLYSIDGRYSKVLINDLMSKGIHELFIDIGEISGGLYVLRSEINQKPSEIRKIMILK
ncbi:S8 family serine peptidase [Aquimarina sp. 2201CG5-10]|uniref:S8 family serine peptidase n=1 Tax=Aquimarina callyspongiae TaxID=3098150 RepID=UPI002AB52C80|nr:S8 family serine peptidase [Aquimarina sp. 2201CG5-10]MDY8134197.1 S8 family serine peptidase [Aquimarina sp. 2201CG5-10]